MREPIRTTPFAPATGLFALLPKVAEPTPPSTPRQRLPSSHVSLPASFMR